RGIMSPSDGLRSLVMSSVTRWVPVLTFLVAITMTARAGAGCQCGIPGPHHHKVPGHHVQQYQGGPGDLCNMDFGGTWYWLRSPEQEKRVVMNLFNRYCIRCHGIDGRGVWDI